jgi:hypothetical protein
MTQLMSLFNQVFGNQTKSYGLEQSSPSKSLQVIKNTLSDLYDAWIEARLEQAKYYNKHNHIE